MAWTLSPKHRSQTIIILLDKSLFVFHNQAALTLLSSAVKGTFSQYFQKAPTPTRASSDQLTSTLTLKNIPKTLK